MNDFSALGENLKAIRDKRGLNLNDVSELTGISKAMLSKIERGESVPTITTVWKIANGLKITLNALAGDGENNYTVKDIATMTPLIDEGGLFSLYNVRRQLALMAAGCVFFTAVAATFLLPQEGYVRPESVDRLLFTIQGKGFFQTGGLLRGDLRSLSDLKVERNIL